MPELPDIALYLEALAPRVLNQPLERLRIGNPFLVRTLDPPVAAVEGRVVVGLRRMGKRIVFDLEGNLFLVLHLMIAGRLRWRERGAAIPRKVGLAAFDFPTGTAILTEQGSSPSGVGAHRRRNSGPRGARSGRPRSPGLGAARIRRAPHAREPHAQAGADRSAHLQRYRQRVLRRDPACGAAVADEAHEQPHRRGDRAAPRRHAAHARDLDCAAAG